MRRIIIVGLGPGRPGYLTREAKRCLAGGRPLFFRTMKHPVARRYAFVEGIYSFEHLYEEGEDFEQVYRAIVKRLVRAASLCGTVYYAVPGHPDVGEAAVAGLRRIAPRLGIELKIVPGISFLEPLLSSLQVDPLDGVKISDAYSLDLIKEPSRSHLIIAQVHSRMLASQVKLKLLELYPPEHPVIVIKAAGMPVESVHKTTLNALDHRLRFNHYTTIYLPPFQNYGMGDLLEIMAKLRSGEGCPWDRQKTAYSLRQYLIEEAYEVVAAIEAEDDLLLKEELGDLLLQIIFHSQIAREESRFDFYQVVDTVAAKLVRRHPHVFGSEEAIEDAAQVKNLWEKIKSGERNEEGKEESIEMDHSLPALLKAYKLQKRAAELGFDWPCVKGPLDKAREELAELEEACLNEDRKAIEEEIGDYLFTVVNVSRFLGVNPELSLGKTIVKFLNRFKYIMEQIEKSERPMSDFSLEELDKWWEEAKKIK